MSGLESSHLQESEDENVEMSAASEDYEQAANQIDSRSRRRTMGDGAICVHFKIPVRKEQLCEEPSNETQFYVKDRYNISQLKEDKILEELENISATVCGPGSKCLEILRNEQFDFLFSIIYYLEDISYKIRT